MKKTVYLSFMAVLIVSGCVSSSEYKARVSEVEACKNDVSSLEGMLKSAEETIKDLNGRIAALDSEITALNNTVKSKDSEIAALGSKNSELSEKASALDEDNKKLGALLEAKKDQLSKEISALRAKLGDTTTRADELSKQVAVLEAKLTERLTAIEVLQVEVASKEKEVALLTARAAGLAEEKEKAVAEMQKTQESLVTEMKAEIEKGEIAITQLKGKLTLSMVDRILFDSGSADVKKDGKKVLDRVGAILKTVEDKQIRVEGHTDNVPISARLQGKFPTNWELSTARATNVVRYLQESAGIDPKKLIAEGYSEFRPVSPNDSEEGRAKNRRIEIVLVPLEAAGTAEGQ